MGLLRENVNKNRWSWHDERAKTFWLFFWLLIAIWNLYTWEMLRDEYPDFVFSDGIWDSVYANYVFNILAVYWESKGRVILAGVGFWGFCCGFTLGGCYSFIRNRVKSDRLLPNRRYLTRLQKMNIGISTGIIIKLLYLGQLIDYRF